MLLRLLAFLTGGTVVVMIDCDDEVTRTVAWPHIGQTLKAWRMLGTRVVLFPDGRVGGASYVVGWWAES